jgi:membrane associated rhomboid family serine protease
LISVKIPALSNLFGLLALSPVQVLHRFAFWQLITYAFLHGSFFHILFNLFALWMFGGDVEEALGRGRFLRLYFLSAIGAALCHLIFNASSLHPVIGASGAIYGVLVAFAVLFPDRVITLLLFFVVPIQMKAKYLAMIFVGLSLFSGIESGLFGMQDGVAHLAHLGGALTGFLFLRAGPQMNDLIFYWRKKAAWRRRTIHNSRQAARREKQEEIDRILDRINQVGYDQLSPDEKTRLKKASEYLAKKSNA